MQNEPKLVKRSLDNFLTEKTFESAALGDDLLVETLTDFSDGNIPHFTTDNPLTTETLFFPPMTTVDSSQVLGATDTLNDATTAENSILQAPSGENILDTTENPFDGSSDSQDFLDGSPESYPESTTASAEENNDGLLGDTIAGDAIENTSPGDTVDVYFDNAEGDTTHDGITEDTIFTHTNEDTNLYDSARNSYLDDVVSSAANTGMFTSETKTFIRIISYTQRIYLYVQFSRKKSSNDFV